MNQFLIVGRIKSIDQICKDDLTTGYITVEVDRPFAESDGQYLTDCFRVRLWRGILETINEKYAVGDVVGIKGRLQQSGDELGLLIAERVSFISH